MYKTVLWMLLLLWLTVDIAFAQRGMQVPGKNAILPESPYRTSWALLIGINKYKHLPADYQLNYAVNDVKALKEILIERYQFPESNIITLIDDQATQQRIKSAMGQLADLNKIKKDDRVLIYFSGHGQTVPLQDGGEMGYIIPYDANVDISNADNPSAYFTTCLGMDELRRLSLLIPAKHVLFLMDACYSGLAVSNRSGLKPTLPSYLSKIASLKSRQIITAGMKGDKSYENPDWGHGAFTYKLLEALRTGAADENSDGVITGIELATHLRNVVPNISPNQTPQYGYFEGEGEFMFLVQQVETAVIEELTTMATVLIDSEPTGAAIYILVRS